MCFRSVCNYCPNLDQVPNVILDQIPQKELDQSTVDPLLAWDGEKKAAGNRRCQTQPM